MILQIVGQVLIVVGALVFLSAGLGLLKLPDLYTRASAVATAAGVGMVLIITGAVLHDPDVPNVIKAVLAVVVQLATSAVASMAVARAAYLTGSPLTELTQVDQAAEDSEPEPR